MVKSYLKKIPLLVPVKRKIRRILDPGKGTTRLNVLKKFPLYAPNSAGTYKSKAPLTIQTINQVMPVLSSFATSVTGRKIDIVSIQDFPKLAQELECAKELKKFLDKYGSDKADNLQNYHYLYGVILKNRDSIGSVLEIGLGTNNLDVVSNMGREGKPGASIRAFRDFLKNAKIYGADIDRKILFEEERIKTFYVDQTNSSSFDDLNLSLPCYMDLIIDDGLHSPNANIETLKFGLMKIKIGGWVVVEDIPSCSIPVWEIVAALLPERYKPYLLKAEDQNVFAVQRID